MLPDAQQAGSDTPRALARLARQVSDALAEFAAGLEPSGVGAEPDEPDLGTRQRQVLEVEELTAAEGMRVADVAEAIKYDPANTQLTLRALEKRGLVELVPGKSPQHWRLTASARRTRRVWDEDEVLLALDLYHRAGVQPAQEKLEATKEILDGWALQRGYRPRPMAGLAFKLANLHALATDGAEGFTHGGKNDRNVWDRYGYAPEDVAEAAQRIKSELEAAT